jgi:enamine deaminase RidA (YjgF/YER057c/UK114 family)
MARIEARLAAMGLQLPQPLQAPTGLSLPFEWVRIRGGRAFVSGQVPLDTNGRLAAPLGKVGAEVSPEQGYASARLVALAHLASLKRALGDLDRITAWLRVCAMVNVAPGFTRRRASPTAILS